MIKSLTQSLMTRVQSIGGELHDRDLQVQKTALVLLSLAAIPIAAIWIPIELSPGGQGALGEVVIGAVLAGANLLLFSRHRKYGLFRGIQLTIFLLWAVANHFGIGGYTSSANVVWAMIVPLLAMLGSRPRDAVPWILAYFGFVALAGLLEPIVFPAGGLTAAQAFFQFSLNIINISVLMFLVMVYFIRQKNQAYERLREEERQSEELLLNVLPKEVAPALKSGNRSIAEHFESVSVLYADIVDFTPLSERMSPDELITLLDAVFSGFDQIVAKYELEKIRTIGDNYMVVSGAPRRRADHAQALAQAALEMAEYAQEMPPVDGEKVDFRMGMHAGPVVGGVIGQSRFHYDVWGDTANTASRMESHGVAGRIQVSTPMKDGLDDEFAFEPRGVIEVKGKGPLETWFLVGRR